MTSQRKIESVIVWAVKLSDALTSGMKKFIWHNRTILGSQERHREVYTHLQH